PPGAPPPAPPAAPRLPLPAVRSGRLVEPAVAAPDIAADAGRRGGGRPERAAAQRPDARGTHPRHPSPHRRGGRSPLPPRRAGERRAPHTRVSRRRLTAPSAPEDCGRPTTRVRN